MLPKDIPTGVMVEGGGGDDLKKIWILSFKNFTSDLSTHDKIRLPVVDIRLVIDLVVIRTFF